MLIWEQNRLYLEQIKTFHGLDSPSASLTAERSQVLQNKTSSRQLFKRQSRLQLFGLQVRMSFQTNAALN